MDEVGSAIQHGENPNFKCMPFLFLDTGIAFSLLWPIENVSKGTQVFRNFYPTRECSFALRFVNSPSLLQQLRANYKEMHICWLGLMTFQWRDFRRHMIRDCPKYPRLRCTSLKHSFHSPRSK